MNAIMVEERAVVFVIDDDSSMRMALEDLVRSVGLDHLASATRPNTRPNSGGRSSNLFGRAKSPPFRNKTANSTSVPAPPRSASVFAISPPQ